MAINQYWCVDSLSANGDGTTWATSGGTAAFSEAGFETFMEGTVAAGDVMYIKDGTYTLDSSYDWNTRDGTSVSPIILIGVKSGTTNVGAAITYSDWSIADADRPFFDVGTNTIRMSDYNKFFNLSFQGDVANMFGGAGGGAGLICFNCKFDSDNAVYANEVICNVNGSYTVFHNCQFSGKANGAYTGVSGRFVNCYFNLPGGYGITQASGTLMVIECIFNACTIGMSIGAQAGQMVYKNTFYGGGTDISATTAATFVGINNLHEGTTADVYKWTTQEDGNYYWNNWGNDTRCTDMWDTVDSSTCHQDYPNNTIPLSGDPGFTAAGTDFSLAIGSSCYNRAKDISLAVGTTVRNGNIGAWQSSIYTAASNVLVGVNRGDGTLGTFDEAARNTDPTVAKVLSGTAYKIQNVALVGELSAGAALAQVEQPGLYPNAHKRWVG